MSLARLCWKFADYVTVAHARFFAPFTQPERVVTVAGRQIHLRRGISDAYAVREVFDKKVYDVQSRGVVFDVGAHIGCFTLLAAKAASIVHAFEPESSNFSQLTKNVRANRYSNVVVHRVAIGGQTGSARLRPAQANYGTSYITPETTPGTQSVEMLTLDAAMKLCGVRHIDVLKIDIEGSEYEVIERTPIETLNRIDEIVMETHWVPGKRVADISTRLKSAGFVVQISHSLLSLLGAAMLHAKRSPASR